MAAGKGGKAAVEVKAVGGARPRGCEAARTEAAEAADCPEGELRASSTLFIRSRMEAIFRSYSFSVLPRAEAR